MGKNISNVFFEILSYSNFILKRSFLGTQQPVQVRFVAYVFDEIIELFLKNLLKQKFYAIQIQFFVFVGMNIDRAQQKTISYLAYCFKKKSEVFLKIHKINQIDTSQNFAGALKIFQNKKYTAAQVKGKFREPSKKLQRSYYYVLHC